MALSFDFDNRQINVSSPQTTVDIQDLINEIRTQEASELGITHPLIAGSSGKESLGGSISVGMTVELINDWQLLFWSGAYQAEVSGGNLVGGIAANPVAYSANVQVIRILSANATLVEGGGGGGGDKDFTDNEKEALFTVLGVVEDTATPITPTSGALSEILAQGLRNLGLSFQNSYRHTRSYDAGHIVSELLDLYDGTDFPNPPGASTKIGSYSIAYTYEDGLVSTMKVTKLS